MQICLDKMELGFFNPLVQLRCTFKEDDFLISIFFEYMIRKIYDK